MRPTIDHRSVGLKVHCHLVYRVRRGGIQHEQRVQQSSGGGLDAAAAAAPDQVVDALPPAGGQQRQRLLLLLPAAATRYLLPVSNPLLSVIFGGKFQNEYRCVKKSRRIGCVIPTLRNLGFQLREFCVIIPSHWPE